MRIACSPLEGAFGPPVVKPDSPPPHSRDSGDWGISNSADPLLVSSATLSWVSRTGSLASPSPKRSFMNIESLSRFIVGSSMAVGCWRVAGQGPFTSSLKKGRVQRGPARGPRCLEKHCRPAEQRAPDAGNRRSGAHEGGAQKRGGPSPV